MTASTQPVKIVAVVAILTVGLIHLWMARDAFGNATYEGLLFVANGIAALVTAVGVQRDRGWGWLLGAVIAGGTLLAYAISRTVGLPGLPAEPDAWLEPLGVVSVVAELVFLFSAARRSFRGDAGQLAQG
jgi:uncharacterized membrane protein HdeD (DUF308 family)